MMIGDLGLHTVFGVYTLWIPWAIGCGFLWLIGFWLLWQARVCGEAEPTEPACPIDEWLRAESDGLESRPSQSVSPPRQVDDGQPSHTRGRAIRVSVIIPARNEGNRLPCLLRSLASQTRPADEIIVVDDRSTDATAAVALAGNATVISAGDLPPGWTGKSWACWIGALSSTGTILVLLDADTTLASDGLARLVAEYGRWGGLVSVQPYHDTVHPYERLSAFLNIVNLMGMNVFTPLGQMLEPPGAFGPCMVCSREDYFKCGGHAAVRSAILEDHFLGRAFHRAGRRVVCLCGRGTVSYRMYPEGFKQMVEGWTKTLGSGGIGMSVPSLLLISLWLIGCGSVALLVIWGFYQSLATWNPLPILTAIALYAAYAAQIHWMLRRIGDFGRLTSVFYPAPLFFLIGVLVRSMVLVFLRRRVRWKGRDIATRPFREFRWGRGARWG